VQVPNDAQLVLLPKVRTGLLTLLSKTCNCCCSKPRNSSPCQCGHLLSWHAACWATTHRPRVLPLDTGLASSCLSAAATCAAEAPSGYYTALCALCCPYCVLVSATCSHHLWRNA
jgi:hypothetical protein